MRRFMLSLATGFGLLAAPISGADAADDTPEAEACKGCEALLELVAAHPRRKDDRVRDVWRHPVETIAFFGVRPDMKVGEYGPGDGWYSRLLALYLGRQGKLVGLAPDPQTVPPHARGQGAMRASCAAYAQDLAAFTEMPVESFAAMTSATVPTVERGTYDRILLPRTLHNLLRWNIADRELRTLHALLKPQGMVGIEQHRARPEAPLSYADGSKGYMREVDVIRLMERNGFALARASEINANPADSADWPAGVWTLPPTLAGDAAESARHAAIGESDRMTLLFRKRA